MPKLVKIETERIYLPSTKDEANEVDRGWVEIKRQAVGGDVLNAGFGVDNMDRTARLMASLVTAWNFTDDEGNPEPINAITVSLMEPDDFSAIAVKLKEIVDRSAESRLPQDGEKKTTSTDTLTPSTPLIPTPVGPQSHQ